MKSSEWFEIILLFFFGIILVIYNHGVSSQSMTAWRYNGLTLLNTPWVPFPPSEGVN